MGHTSIQNAHLAPQYNREAVDRLVPVSMSRRSAKKGGESAWRENEVVTKSAASQKTGFEIEF
jgi:hypothetical protein